MRFSRLLSILIVVLLLPIAAALAADEATQRCQRLVLKEGGHQDVREPITRKDGMIYFFDTEGIYSSVQARLVREVEPLDACPNDEPGAPAAPSAPRAVPTLSVAVTFDNSDLPAGRVDDGATFSNTDLPPEPVPDEGSFSNNDLPEPVANEEMLDDADPPQPASEPDESTFTNEHLPAPVTPEPTAEPAAAPEIPLEQLEAEIAEAEKEEAVLVRFLDCAKRGVDLDSADCRPPANEMPKQKVVFRDPTEASLTQQLEQVRGKLEGLRSGLERPDSPADEPVDD